MKERKPNRLKQYDYSWPGYYFITICTQNRVEYFGTVEKGKMLLSPIGELAYQFCSQIPNHFPDINVDEFVIMPNHVHAIIIIEPDPVGNANLRSLQDRTKMTLSKVVQQYKSAVTRSVREINPDHPFTWQKSFYDHIIRNEKSLYRIRNYTINNPLKWEYDRENLNEIPLKEKKIFWNKFFQEAEI